MSLPLSFLDLVHIESGSTSADALSNAVGLAQEAERLGYTRYWFAEHHNSIGLASASPEIMVAHVAAQTNSIRVGTGGVMLPNHAPLRIAEAFHLLEALHPGRIDLGLGRAPGTDTLTAYAMRRSEEAIRTDQYPSLLAELLAFDTREFPPAHPFHRIQVTPTDVKLPPIWLLGSSDFSAEFAAEVGLGYSFAAHFSQAPAGPIMRMYRERFTPSQHLAQPHSILAVSVVVGDDEEQVAELRHIVEIGYAALLSGRPYQMPSHEQARQMTLSDDDLQRVRARRSGVFVGSAATVVEGIRALAEETQADEVMITTSLPNQTDRLRTIRNLAEAWGLEATRELVATSGSEAS